MFAVEVVIDAKDGKVLLIEGVIRVGVGPGKVVTCQGTAPPRARLWEVRFRRRRNRAEPTGRNLIIGELSARLGSLDRRKPCKIAVSEGVGGHWGLMERRLRGTLRVVGD